MDWKKHIFEFNETTNKIYFPTHHAPFLENHIFWRFEDFEEMCVLLFKISFFIQTLSTVLLFLRLLTSKKCDSWISRIPNFVLVFKENQCFSSFSSNKKVKKSSGALRALIFLNYKKCFRSENKRSHKIKIIPFIFHATMRHQYIWP